jgi:thiamine-monophosphate kinase
VVDERELIEAIVAELDSSRNRAGFDSDCAIVPLGDRDLVATTDGFAEATHFPEGATPGQAGHLAAAGAISDLAAAGAGLVGVLAAYGFPEHATTETARDVSRGVQRVVDEVDGEVLGGDTKPRAETSITITGLGTCPKGQALTREGAWPGDRLLVTGALGGAGAALDRVRSGMPADEATPLLEPRPRIEAGRQLRELGARCAMDLSDGLAEAALAISGVSEASLIVERDRIPLHAWAREGDRGIEHALETGGDYEVLACVPEPRVNEALGSLRRLGVDPCVVGRVEEGSDAALETQSGRVELGRGFEHAFGRTRRQD